jgi:integrase
MSIYKRGNVYWTKFGLYGQIFRESLRTSDWQEAKDEEKRLIAKAQEGKILGIAPGVPADQFARLPFAAAVELYCRDREPNLAETTQGSEFDHATPLIRFFSARAARGAETRVNRITEAVIREYISERRKAGGRRKAGCANATINKELGILRGVLRRAKCWHLFSDEIKRLKEPKSHVGRALEHGEKLRLVRVGSLKPKWERAYRATRLALNTAMRKGEILHLQWRDVNFLDRTILVRRGKTDESVREIPLNREAYDVMVELRGEASKLWGPDLSPDWYVFYWWPVGRVPDPTRPAKGFRSAWRSLTRAIQCPGCGEIQKTGEKCVKCGAEIKDMRNALAGLRFHDLRHQAITELSEGQASDETIMSIAGHIDRKMMSHYSHVRRQARRVAVEALDKGLVEQLTLMVEGSEKGGDRAQRGAQSDQFGEAFVPQVAEKNGGDDETRTRDLCRDRTEATEVARSGTPSKRPPKRLRSQ